MTYDDAKQLITSIMLSVWYVCRAMYNCVMGPDVKLAEIDYQ